MRLTVQFTRVTPAGTGHQHRSSGGSTNRNSQASKVVIHWFNLMKQLSQPSQMETEDYSRQANYNCATWTFTPDKKYVGTPAPVTVRRVDKNGTPVTATYSPEFTKVTPTGTGVTSTGPQGVPPNWYSNLPRWRSTGSNR